MKHGMYSKLIVVMRKMGWKREQRCMSDVGPDQFRCTVKEYPSAISYLGYKTRNSSDHEGADNVNRFFLHGLS